MSVSDYVKTDSADLSADEILQSPLDILLGVSANARAAVDALNIRTVFDLAASQIFATAAALVATETDATTVEARLNGAAADAVIPPPGLAVGEWSRQGLTILAGITAEEAIALSTALSLTTVRDLALWPPYLAAKSILQGTLRDSVALGDDPEAPSDLIPKSGVYPTERVFFTKLLIDLAPQPDQGVAPLEQAGAIDLGASLTAPTAFQRLATGALLSFRQSWYSEGVTLGQLLHSLTLAPGESTRVAMIDWSRQVSASVTEQIDESEQLANTEVHNRSLTEVTDATATEFQSGSSSSQVTSQSDQSGSALGIEIGPLALGQSGGGGSSTTTAMSASSSFGARDLAASLAQNINDRTQQNASVARNRRASIVSEVSQDEHESITTRIVTNYNHMHALNVQYFEVVQAYRVTTELDRAERCIFVPLKLLSFTDPATVDRLRDTLSRAALTATAFRQLTTEYGAVEIIPKTPRVIPGRINIGDLVQITSAVIPATTPAPTTGTAPPPAPVSDPNPLRSRIVTVGRVAGAAITPTLSAETTTADSSPAATAVATKELDASTLLSVNQRFVQAPPNAPVAVAAAKGWDLEQIGRLGSLTTRVPLRVGSDSVFVPDDALLLSIGLRDGTASKFQIRKRDNTELAPLTTTPTGFVLANPTSFADIQAIALQSSVDRDVETTLVMSISVNNAAITLDVPVQFRSHATVTTLQDIVSFGAVGPSPELIQHLETNRLHYSRAVFATLDAAAIAGLLARFSYKGLPLAQVADPEPVGITANFLVFRLNVSLAGDPDDERFADAQSEFRDFLKTRGLDTAVAKSEIVPLPSGGVFAEAVLGRFNAAEKIDLKRFWNWQDSPIPIAAPDIAPISSGSRAEADNVTPGQLGAPIVTIQSPVALPAAAGVGPALTAIQNANMFRDMSGLAQTAALAQSAVTATGAGATAAGAQAGKNLFTVMDQHTQRMRIAADLAASMMGVGGGSGQSKGGTSVSEQGAQLNAAQALDKKNASGGGTSTAAGAPTSTSTGGTPVSAPPVSLEHETLAQQSGSGVSTNVAKLVGAATTPDSGASAAQTTPIPIPTPLPIPAGLPVPGDPPPDLVPLPPRHFHLNVVFYSTDDVQIGGNRQMSLTQFIAGDTTTLLEVAGGPGQSLFGGFHIRQDATTGLSLAVGAGATADGGALNGTKTLTLPAGGLTSLVGGQETLEVHVKPVLRKTTLKVPFVTFPTPDLDNLESQLTALGIPKQLRAGDPDLQMNGFEGYTATVRSFTGELLITQFL